jgi:hypothetical protein
MKTKKLLLLFMLAPLLMVSSCNNDENDPINCTTEFVDGLRITVLDQANGQPIVEGVTVTAVDGSYTENLELVSGVDNFFAGAGERVGTYTVTVTKNGYQTFTSSPIVVTRNVCHVITQSLTVNLVAN